MQAEGGCERDQSSLVPVQANQDPRTYPLLNTELDGRYHLIGGLGQGGVGTVYLANHIHLDQLSAVKFLDIDMLGEVDEEQREESLQDFVKEAKLAMMLRHDYVVRVMDYGVHERCPFLVMEYVPGPSLLRRMNAGERFSTEQCVNVITRLAEALSAFHDRKLVHRDLKPANVILDPRDNGELTLVDLGLVKDLSNEARSSTHPLALRGTPGYLAPEQVPSWVLSSAGVEITSEKQPVDTRVDIFALGVLAFELLSGQTPYPKGMSPTKVIVYTCTMPAPDLASICPDIQATHPWFIKLVIDMMARKPTDRPLDAREVLARISSGKEGVKSTPLTGHDLSQEIQRATNALIDHVKPTSLTSDAHSSAPYMSPPSVQGAPPSVMLQRSPQSTPMGSLIPPPASLMRPNIGGYTEDINRTEESTVHFDEPLGEGADLTVDEPSDQLDFSSGAVSLMSARTEVADRPLNYRSQSPIIVEPEINIPEEVYQSESTSTIFWVGVMLVSAIIGGASVLFTAEAPPPVQQKLVLGSVKSNSLTKTSSARRKLNQNDELTKSSVTTPIRLGTIDTPKLRRPTKLAEPSPNAQDTKSNTRSQKTSQSGVVEVEINQETTEVTPTVKRRVKRPSSRRKSTKRAVSKKSTDRSTKPITRRQYKLLKLQVENLLRNQRIAEARRKLLMIKRWLKPSDAFYMEINMLLDSISP